MITFYALSDIVKCLTPCFDTEGESKREIVKYLINFAI